MPLTHDARRVPCVIHATPMTATTVAPSSPERTIVHRDAPAFVSEDMLRRLRTSARNYGYRSLVAGVTRITESTLASSAHVSSFESMIDVNGLAPDVSTDVMREVAEELDIARVVGARLVTTESDEYPIRLLGHELRPMLFVLGGRLGGSELAVVLTGTKRADIAGIRRAADYAEELTARGVRVIAGLSPGIESAVHRSVIDAGGMPICVVATGVGTTHPAQQVALQHAIIEAGGSIVSPFWPSMRANTSTFPRRDEVMATMANALVVVEVCETYGAQAIARAAASAGTEVMLHDDVVDAHGWATRAAARGWARRVSDLDDVLDALGLVDAADSETEFDAEFDVEFDAETGVTVIDLR
jgi:DNA processing protein